MTAEQEPAPGPIDSPAAEQRPAPAAVPGPLRELTESYAVADDGASPPAPEPDPEPAPAPATPGPASPGQDGAQPPAHSRASVRLALDLGVPQALIDRASPQELDDFVYEQTKKALESSRAPAPAAPAQEPPAEDDLDLPEDEFDPKLVKALRSLKDRDRKRDAELKELREFRDRQQQTEQQRQAQAQVRHIDSLFAGLGPEYEAVLGKGGREALAPGGPELTRRMAVLSAAAQMEGGSDQERLLKAARALFGAPAPAEKGPEKPSPKKQMEEAYRGGGLATPTRRKGAGEPPGYDRAVRAVAAAMEGREPADEAPEDLNGFLD